MPQDNIPKLVWRTADGQEIPFNELTPKQLQDAYNFAENRTLHHYNMSALFESLMTGLEEEARARGFELRSIDDLKALGEFLSNRYIWKQSKSIHKENPD